MPQDHPNGVDERSMARRLAPLLAAGALALTLGLSACGDDDATPGDVSPPPSTAHVTSTTAPRSLTSTTAARATTTTTGVGGSVTTTAGGSPTTTSGDAGAGAGDSTPAGGGASANAADATNGSEAPGGSTPDGTTNDSVVTGDSGPTVSVPPCDLYTTNAQYPLKACDTGYDILLVQQALVTAGFDVPTDGNFDPTTDAGVRAYQQQFGLTVDGEVGMETWKSLVPEASGEDVNNNGVVDPFEVTTG